MLKHAECTTIIKLGGDRIQKLIQMGSFWIHKLQIANALELLGFSRDFCVFCVESPLTLCVIS